MHLGKNPQIVNTGPLPINGGQNSRTVMREELSLEFGEFLTLQSSFVMIC